MDVPVTVISGSYDNIKITTQDDLIFAEAILSKQNAETQGSQK
jgi:2-C-methyl-D-erythritol 4-phosphate cytidylyltransferase